MVGEVDVNCRLRDEDAIRCVEEITVRCRTPVNALCDLMK